MNCQLCGKKCYTARLSKWLGKRGSPYRRLVSVCVRCANTINPDGTLHLTPLALDGAIAPDNQQVLPADVLVGEGTLPEPPRQ